MRSRSLNEVLRTYVVGCHKIACSCHKDNSFRLRRLFHSVEKQTGVFVDKKGFIRPEFVLRVGTYLHSITLEEDNLGMIIVIESGKIIPTETRDLKVLRQRK